ncbi:unnamed protein product [Microthlaspi erraticum]|uniref:Uncharacterized protein n=1 Tax=Microthlaspi erraticum TaxID=1685480 RepID=A0A6D2JUM0_9BRAS|nr:unnamed protein product [Microthlaspi erraticum]
MVTHSTRPVAYQITPHRSNQQRHLPSVPPGFPPMPYPTTQSQDWDMKDMLQQLLTRASQRVCSSCYTEKWATISKQGSPPQIAVDIDDEEGEDLVEYDDIPAPNSIELEQNPEPELDRAEETETQTDKASSSQPAKPVAKKKDTPAGPPPYKPPTLSRKVQETTVGSTQGQV